jgi:phosphoribosylformimino-5-aminoimidazole carboxamide ribotide isomerase
MADTSFDVIPSIDLIDGKCVRLRQGNFEEVTQFADDPLVIAQQFEEAGLKRLHVVDLDGARAREVRHWHVLELLAKETSLKIDFSGGFTTLAEVERALNLGAQQVAIGSLAVRDAALFSQMLTHFGSEKMILSADVLDGSVKVSGWTESTALTIDDLVARFAPSGLRWVMVTDISRDGMLEGPNLALYQRLAASFPTLALLASGGVSNLSDVLALKKIGVAGAVIGRAILEGDLDPAALEAYQS